MLSVSKLTVAFGGEELFSEISFLINKGDRVGLVGKNGAGKSTLLKVISGQEEKEQGEIAMPNEATIGYLAQDIALQDGRLVREEAFAAFEELIYLNKQQEDISLQLSQRDDYESDAYSELIERLNTITDRITILGGATADAEVEKVLFGLGFKSSDLDRPTSEFSGGWRMRVELAKLLLQKPDVLLLDEPTNHLDIESIIWLERFLVGYEGAIMLVSHDKAFLDNVTNRTIEISLGSIYDYKASYTKYLTLRKERREQQIQAHKNQEKEIKQTEDLIERFRYKANKASFAQSLIKKLDRMDRIEVDEEDTKTMRFKFQVSQQPGKVVLELDKVSKTYGNHEVLKDIELLVERGDKIAFVGQNGQGKTTLARIIADDLSYEGSLKLGHNVELAYFAQNQSELLDGEKTLLRTIEDAASKETFSKSRDLLGSFLFSGDDVEKKVKVLSGGEKGRLAMCKLLLRPANVLILDEPTNHLDIRSKEILKQSVKNYEGTVILVSHDREFLDGLVDKVYEFKGGSVKEYLGGITDFLKQKSLQDFRTFEQQGIANTIKTEKEVSDNKLSYEQRKQLDKDIRKLNNKEGKLSKEIESLEEELRILDEELADPEKFKVHSSDPEFYSKYDQKRAHLDTIMEEWEQVAMDLDDLKSKRD